MSDVHAALPRLLTTQVLDEQKVRRLLQLEDVPSGTMAASAILSSVHKDGMHGPHKRTDVQSDFSFALANQGSQNNGSEQSSFLTRCLSTTGSCCHQQTAGYAA